ncbi:Glycosyl hydrolases family 35 [Eubacterium uniforme]|uniref:Glycosyl hydrolases family 35 n=1 Tax=Eubacterium uniforme TaxID=39495 RepID=A0A1T4V4X7_9FIRM|nr:beta-galactosidase [Eubacterium uniforme]SKA59995.1 Glycosyl hydrolases family 35 [Eubacterium uniforme]
MKEKFGYNNICLTKNEKPYFPIMGEMHYARVSNYKWREELLKMKNCGIDIVSTYVFWIFHEQLENEYDFSGDLNIREFIKIADEVGLKVWLRLGPFVHSELRNGGFPDWLINKCPSIRSEDETYISEVKKYLSRIYEEVKGLFNKDNGPIIGIQVENELGHVGGVDKESDEKHMKHLLEIIKKIGFDVPYYTATGWGGAIVADCIPVMGGYCDAPWERSSEKLPPNTNYVITKERDDHMIGQGHEIGGMESYKYADFPYLTAELGGGLCPTYRRRPVVSGKDIASVSLVKLANGCNLLGYYMFHGGVNPKGINYPLNETIATGSWCDLPEFDYDFNSPIGSYGNITDKYNELKLLFMFIKDFGEKLCLMESDINTIIDENGKEYEDVNVKPDNLEGIRYSIRHNCESGFVFVNNYVRGYELSNHKDVKLEDLKLVKKIKDNYFIDVKMLESISTFPSFDINNGDYFFYPINLKVGDMLIKNATATPLCVLKDENGFEDYAILYGDDAKLNIEYGEKTQRIVLSKEEALKANKITLDREYVIIANGTVVVDDGKIYLYSDNDDEIKIYPENSDLQLNDVKIKDNEASAEVNIIEQKEFVDNVHLLNSKDVKTIEYKIKVNYNFNISVENALDNIYLNVLYDGDVMKTLINGEVVNDNFNNGKACKIGLKGYGYPREIVFRIYGLDEDNDKYFDENIEYKDGFACELKNIETICNYKKLIYENK